MKTTLNRSWRGYAEQEFAYILDSFFPGAVIAGFTKPVLKGKPDTADDARKALAFTGRSFGVAYMTQEHGADVKTVEKTGAYKCDGLFTRQKDLALVVKTADCLPLLFHSEKEGVAGAVHMGWRSAEAGILENIPYELQSFKVAVGVGMRKCCYAVGKEFTGYPKIAPYLELYAGKYYFDPVRFAKDSLVRKGLRLENFTDIDICSYCSERGFYSHRKTATPDRTLSFIVINNE